MHSVTAEVAQEVAVLLQDRDRHTGPGQQQPEHHSGGTTAHHTARGLLHGNRSLRRTPRVNDMVIYALTYE
ncbi:hypothetical protein GCM10010207_67750 [Streptomyces atratus]|nr:hypothetical protein GCM10010207_67750 [Streptomyces atratus]